MAVLVANMEAHFRPLMSVEQYRYGYNNVAAHSHQHVVNVSILFLIYVSQFSYHYCLLNLCKLSKFLICKVSRVPHHLAFISCLRDMTNRVVCPDAVVVLLYMVFSLSVSSVGLIFATVWVDAVHFSQERCVRHTKSQTRYPIVVY